MSSNFTIIQRVNLITDRRYRDAILVMRSCGSCQSAEVFCCVNRQYLKCKKCYRKNHKCKLTLNYKKMNETIRRANVLDDEILKIQLKLSRKKKKRKHWLRRLRDLDNKKFENILKLKENETREEMQKHSFTDTLTITSSDLFLCYFLFLTSSSASFLLLLKLFQLFLTVD